MSDPEALVAEIEQLGEKLAEAKSLLGRLEAEERRAVLSRSRAQAPPAGTTGCPHRPPECRAEGQREIHQPGQREVMPLPPR